MSMFYEFDHSAESVFGLLTDPQFLVDRCLALGELEANCEVEGQGDSTEVSMTRKIERKLPGFLKNIMDSVQTIHLLEHWQPDDEDGWTGEYTFEVEGQPVSIRAKFELYPTESGCCYTIEHRVKAKIPLIGGRLEKYIQVQAEEGCEAEIDYLRTHLG